MSTENDLSDMSRIQQKRVILRGWWTGERDVEAVVIVVVDNLKTFGVRSVLGLRSDAISLESQPLPNYCLPRQSTWRYMYNLQQQNGKYAIGLQVIVTYLPI